MKKLSLALSTGALVLALTLTGCATSSQNGAGPSASSAPESTVNAADEMFVTMMIPHHQQAVEMAEIVLEKDGVASQVAELAQKVKDAQGPEIDRMLGWLDDWGVKYDPNGGATAGMDHGSMSGMMSDADMTMLKDADGPAASRLFLEQMIQHHQGAVKMAETALEGAKNSNVRQLAQQVIDDQTAEIATMQDLLTKI